MRLHAEARPARSGDRSAEQHMVGEDEIGRQSRAQSRGVQLDEPLALRSRQVLEQSRLEPFVTVEDEDRQQPADLWSDDLCRPDVVQLGVPLLREDDNLVARHAPFPRQGARIDVGARPAQEVAVPQENLQSRRTIPGVRRDLGSPYVRWKYSA